MAVHHADGLPMRVDGRRADKHETASLEVFAKCSGLWRHGWYVANRRPGMLDGLAAHKPPLMGIEGAELLAKVLVFG